MALFALVLKSCFFFFAGIFSNYFVSLFSNRINLKILKFIIIVMCVFVVCLFASLTLHFKTISIYTYDDDNKDDEGRTSGPMFN